MAKAAKLAQALPKNSALFLCDMQERFKGGLISHYPQILETSARMLQAAKILDMPVIVTEQYPKGKYSGWCCSTYARLHMAFISFCFTVCLLLLGIYFAWSELVCQITLWHVTGVCNAYILSCMHFCASMLCLMYFPCSENRNTNSKPNSVSVFIVQNKSQLRNM